MEKISSSLASSSSTKLDDPVAVEGDEFYIKTGWKGRSYHNQRIRSGRRPRKRELKPWRGTGTFYKTRIIQ